MLLNMSDPVGASTNLTKRGSTWQFVLRVPSDLVPEVGRKRIQLTLGTTSETEARRRTLPHLQTWEARFAVIRARRGLNPDLPLNGALDTAGWTWPDWEALARWLEASLLEDDWQERLRAATGACLLHPIELPRRGEPFKTELLELRSALPSFSEYERHRLQALKKMFGRLGCRLLAGGPYYDTSDS